MLPRVHCGAVALPSVLRRLARAIKRLPDRLLHDGRRRRARERVAALAPDSLLFVCHGNICRSPFAEAAARLRVPPHVRVASAGFIGPDRGAPDEAVEAARRFGIDLTAHRSRLITGETARRTGLVVVMTPDQARAAVRLGAPPDRVLILGDLDPEPIGLRSIPDPIERPLDEFMACYRRVDRCIAALVTLLPPRRTGA